MSLYNRKCELCGKGIISLYHPDSGLTVYCNKCWWSDKWDPKSFGVDYDFSKPFFTQFRELVQKVPHMAIVNDDGIASLNCEYTHDWWFSKNCYMCFSGWYTENVMYSFFVLAGKNIVDCMNIRFENEWAYDCLPIKNCYQLKSSQICIACIDSQFLYDCRDCSNCFLCCGLRGKKYYFKNKQYTKEDYEKILAEYKLDTFSGMEKARKELEQLILNYPRRYVQGIQCHNCIGELISYSKNVKYSHNIINAENVRYSEFVGDTNKTTKDSHDLTLSGGLSESYEGVVMDHSQLNLFGLFTVKSQDVRYNQHCHNCKHIFGCVGLRNTNYAIFNSQYTKEQYEILVPKIIEQMNAMPYVDKKGNKYKYGEFFPAELSYFGYNESCAMEQFPLSKEEAIKSGYKWQDHVQKTIGKETIRMEDIPDSIQDIQDEILEETLKCIDCERNYKIVRNELNFYRKMKIPIPRKCFYCRHKMRVEKSNPFKIWHKQCACIKDNHGHSSQCTSEFETSYDPQKPTIVYCEKCYQAEVY